jgi:hypothetical protein
MLNRHVDIQIHNGKRYSGFVSRVYRNVLDNQVELTIGGKVRCFEEPNLIVQDGEELVFIYGHITLSDESDDALFAEARMSSHSGESMDDIIKRTNQALKKESRFKLGEKLETKKELT